MVDLNTVLSRLDKTAAPVLDVVDSHTCGQPTRVILHGAGLEIGEDAQAARARMQAERDWVRRVAVFEPRGHRSMFVAALIQPSPGDDDYGVVFMDANSYPDMCGHATIGVTTTLLELGLVGPTEPNFTGVHELGLRTPAGRIALSATMREGQCVSVAFRTPFAYYLGAVQITLGDGSKAKVEVAYGGQWYGFIRADVVGLKVRPDQMDALINAAVSIRQAVADTLDLVDPRTNTVPSVGNIVWVDDPNHPTASALNVPVSQSGSFDRSPCGTATCARMAALVANEQLEMGTPFINESVLGTLYQGRAVEPYKNGNIVGIRPEVQGSAWITSSSRLRMDPSDPLRHGYLIGGGTAVM